jgi:hypothetical protein
VEPHPTPHAFFAFGSNAPNPLAGDAVILGICKVIKDSHRLFGSHRGIGESLGGGEAGEVDLHDLLRLSKIIAVQNHTRQ